MESSIWNVEANGTLERCWSEIFPGRDRFLFLIPVRSQAKSTRPRLHHHTGTTSEPLPDLLPHEERSSTRCVKQPHVCPSPETPADADKTHTLPQDVFGSIYAMRETSAVCSFTSLVLVSLVQTVVPHHQGRRAFNSTIKQPPEQLPMMSSTLQGTAVLVRYTHDIAGVSIISTIWEQEYWST